jgi:16S rRNA (guanine527-N7)-methyltransferase
MMEHLVTEAEAMGVVLNAEQTAQFAIYLRLLLEWNERLNLTAVRDSTAIAQRHFYDSLTCALVMGDLHGRTLIDVGSGAGFPGLPLKIAFPELQLTLVESVNKKARFLQTVVAELGLPGVHILAQRAEELGQQPAHREQYDWAVARGVAEMRILAEYLLPLCRVRGAMLAQKGENAAVETAVAAHAIHLLGGGEPRFHQTPSAPEASPHFLVVVEKIASTPTKYPRRVGVPGKRPL